MTEKFKKTEGNKFNQNDNYADQVIKNHDGKNAGQRDPSQVNIKARDQI